MPSEHKRQDDDYDAAKNPSEGLPDLGRGVAAFAAQAIDP
jgi:hypothetical protein